MAKIELMYNTRCH